MATYTVDVEPVATAQITGRLGTAVVIYRGNVWRVPLGGRGTTKNGYPAGLDTAPRAVYEYASKMYDMLQQEYLRRSGV